MKWLIGVRLNFLIVFLLVSSMVLVLLDICEELLVVIELLKWLLWNMVCSLVSIFIVVFVCGFLLVLIRWLLVLMLLVARFG